MASRSHWGPLSMLQPPPISIAQNDADVSIIFPYVRLELGIRDTD